MPSLQQPVVQFDELLPDRPVLPNSSLPPSEYIQQRRARYKQLNLLHSLLYTSYDCTIECLYDRHELCMQIIVRIIERAIASSATAQQAAASFSSARYLESAKDVARRKMVGDVFLLGFRATGTACSVHSRISLLSHCDSITLILLLKVLPLVDITAAYVHTGLHWTCDYRERVIRQLQRPSELRMEHTYK